MQIGVSFFATSIEIGAWLEPLCEKFNLNCAVEKFFQKVKFRPFDTWLSFRSLRSLNADRFWMDLKPIRLDRQKDLAERLSERGALCLHPPRRSEGGICEAWLVGVTHDPVRLKVWRAIIRVVKQNTKGGMWVLNPGTGNNGFYSTMRYSPTLAELNRQGKTLRPFAGGNLVFVDKPSGYRRRK